MEVYRACLIEGVEENWWKVYDWATVCTYEYRSSEQMVDEWLLVGVKVSRNIRRLHVP